jgi:hypothetical protein
MPYYDEENYELSCDVYVNQESDWDPEFTGYQEEESINIYKSCLTNARTEASRRDHFYYLTETKKGKR